MDQFQLYQLVHVTGIQRVSTALHIKRVSLRSVPTSESVYFLSPQASDAAAAVVSRLLQQQVSSCRSRAGVDIVTCLPEQTLGPSLGAVTVKHLSKPASPAQAQASEGGRQTSGSAETAWLRLPSALEILVCKGR